MEHLGHSIKALAAVDQYRLRCLEAFARFQLPGKALRVNAGCEPQMIVLVPLYPNAVIAAINQLEGPDLAAVLRGLRRAEGGEGRILRAAGSTGAADGNRTMPDQPPVHLKFLLVGAVKSHQLFAVIGHIQQSAEGPFHPDGARSLIGDLSGADDGGAVLQDRIAERQRRAGRLVPESNGQGFGPFSIQRADVGQVLRRVQALRDLIALIAEASGGPAVLPPEGKGALPVIPLMGAGKFLGLHLQGKGGLLRIGGGGKGPLHGLRTVGAMVSSQPGAPIAVQQPGVFVKLTDITDLAAEQMKLAVVKLYVKGIHLSASSGSGSLRGKSPFPGGKILRTPAGP